MQIGRESVTLFAGWIRDCLSLGAAPAFMDQMLFSFDFSLFNWVGALELGGACVLCPRETIAERGAFMQYLADTGIAVWASTPSFVRQQCSTRTSTAPACLACASSSSAPSRSRLRWPRNCGSASPMRASSIPTVRPKPPARPPVEIDAALRQAAPNPFPIGRAKPYADVFIDQGEICIAGDHVMRGYLNRPDLNASRMFTRGGKRGYRSGDLGEIDGQGLITFRGRIDDQIKLHGYRIELAEIDAAIAALPGVRAGATVALRRTAPPSSG